MTRNEAINKLKSFNYDEAAESFVDMAEALGLIKFDEEVKVPPVASVIALHVGNYPFPHNKADEIIDDLLKYGYKIVKK